MSPKTQPAFVTRVVELLSPHGDPTAKAMFGGYGLYLDGRCMAIVVDQTLYVKGDPETLPAYAKRTMAPFTYDMNGKVGTMSYYAVSKAAMKDPKEFDALVQLADSAAKRSAAKKRK